MDLVGRDGAWVGWPGSSDRSGAGRFRNELVRPKSQLFAWSTGRSSIAFQMLAVCLRSAKFRSFRMSNRRLVYSEGAYGEILSSRGRGSPGEPPIGG
jgi:hypothetical protein